MNNGSNHHHMQGASANGAPNGVAPDPWRHDPAAVSAWLAQRAGVRAWQLWLLRADDPAADELLASSGFDEPALQRWVTRGRTRDELMRLAMRHGAAQGRIEDAGLEPSAELPRAAAAVVCAQIESPNEGLWWRLVAARPAPAFSQTETETLAIVLRLWQALFNRPCGQGAARLILGADDRLIHADPACRLLMLGCGLCVTELVARMHEIRAQRWPGEDDGLPHDFALEMGGAVRLVVMQRVRPVAHTASTSLGAEPRAAAPDAGEASHLRVELRPLEEGELPAVGRLEDDRIARALAYIHDHYRESPDLSCVARQAHISPFHFHRVFTRCVGVSPKHYVQMKQLQEARWRLRSERTPVGAIARETGFASHGHFTATFRRAVGLSPTEYRHGREE